MTLDDTPLLWANGLRKSFQERVVFGDVNLTLRTGEVALLRGENGSGKTTLINILTGAFPADSGVVGYAIGERRCQFRFPRSPGDGGFDPARVARLVVGRTWQDLRLFSPLSVLDNLLVASPDHPTERLLPALFTPWRVRRRDAELARTAREMLDRLDLGGVSDSAPDALSLGQAKRVAIGRALMAGARVLFLDEPLASLDRAEAEAVVRLLAGLVRNERITLVIVEHVFNQPRLHGLVTTDWLLAGGRITASGDGLTPLVPAAADLPPWLSRVADGAEGIVEPLPRGAELIRYRMTPTLAPPPLEFRYLVVARGRRVVVGLDDDGRPAGLTLTIGAGEVAVLRAPNGWGKTTLFDALAGRARVERGEVRTAGQRIDRLTPWERFAAGLRALPSDQPTFPRLRVRDVLPPGGREAADLLVSHPDVRCGSLSGGQRQRLALGTLPPGRVTVLDEPWIGLDSESVSKVLPRLRPPADGATLILCPR